MTQEVEDEGTQEENRAPNTWVLPPSTVPQVHRGGRKRLKSAIEAVRDGRRSKHTPPTCSFCGEPGHNKSRCNKKLSLGFEAKDDMQRAALVRNMSQLQVICTETGPIKESLPSGVISLVIHGSCRPENGPMCVMVSVLCKGLCRHAQFAEEVEPHPILESVVARWIYSQGKNKHTFVKEEGLLVT